MDNLNFQKAVKVVIIIILVGLIGNLLYRYGGDIGHEFGHWLYDNKADHIE